MTRRVRSLPLFLALLFSAPALPLPLASAEDGADPPAKAPAPADAYEQSDRRKIMSMKLPRSWKNQGAEDADPKALASYMGFFGEENKSPNGFAVYFTLSQFSRAMLARSIDLPTYGKVMPESLRDGPGWTEGCVTTGERHAIWQRYVEKNGRVYLFRFEAHADAYEGIRETVQKLLDTANVPGDFAGTPLGDAFTARKVAGFDVLSDAQPDREGSVKKVIEQFTGVREIMTKALPGKPFDAGRPVAWVFQNAKRYDDRVKDALHTNKDFSAFSPPDRAALASILGENANGNLEALTNSGAAQYVWQYFGGQSPIWVATGLAAYGQNVSLGGGKKLQPEVITKARAAVAAGKRRLDQWFDVVNWNDVSDNDQGVNELFSWHWYFRQGKGVKKFKKPYDAYLQSLRDTGDPAVARKAFDGVNFEEMLQDFRGWAADWK